MKDHVPDLERCKRMKDLMIPIGLVIWHIVLALCLFPIQCEAWETIDTALLASSTTLLVVDWRQTRYISDGPWDERNPMLGTHPSKGSVDTYFLTCITAHMILSTQLPEKWRRAWMGGVALISLGCVANNLSIGVGIQW